MTIPVSHLEQAQVLEADEPVQLWEIRLRSVPVRIYFCARPTVTWQGNTYEQIGCVLKGEADYATEQNARPTLSLQTPEKVFNPFATAEYFDLAQVIRKEVLPTHLNSNANIFRQRVWVVGRPSSVHGHSLQLELRGPTDFPNFQIPPRYFSPPEFPFVGQ
jgi:phage-related protein